MINVELWELVRDWIHARYKRIKVEKFDRATDSKHYLGRIFVKGKKDVDDIGFAAAKGIVIWPPPGKTEGSAGHYMKYVIIKATDPEMFEKLDKILRMYEPKRSK